MTERIRLVVFDWAGTTVDFGCFAPLLPFIDVLDRNGVRISEADARGPMGLDKKDHLRALLTLPDVLAQWRVSHGGASPDDGDIDRMFSEMVPLAVESVRARSRLIEGVREMVAGLRERGIAIGSTTGYFREAADACYAAAAAEGFAPDASFCASDVPQARPAPWMMFRVMEALGVYPAHCVLKIGDTLPDIGEGRAAGCWSAGVTASGSEMGLSEAELLALPAGDRARRIEAISARLLDAGAHAVIETVRDTPRLIDDIESRLRAGERP